MWKIQEEEYKIKLDQARTFERELLDSRSQPLRQYLNDNVVPFITEGLVELIKSNTNDPVDFLVLYSIIHYYRLNSYSKEVYRSTTLILVNTLKNLIKNDNILIDQF